MRPETEAELAEMIKTADAPLSVRGGNTRGMAPEGQVLDTTGLSGVELYEPGALTLVVKAGTPVAEVEAMLAAEGQRLPFEPMDHRALLGSTGAPTMGGMAATNTSGPRRVQAGACRDYMLGVRFVDGAGTVLKNGGRVMKNVTGYDLVKLMAGSYGTLGVLSEVSFKVLPQPEAAACVLIEGLSDEVAVQAMSAALGSPYDVTGAAHAPVGVDGTPVTMIRVEGFAGSVAYRAAQLKDLLGGFGDLAVETAPERLVAGWKWIRDVEAFAGQEGDVWRISVKPSDGPGLVDVLKRSRPDISVLYDWGGGLLWVQAPAGDDIRPYGLKGHATLVRASAETKARVGMLHPEPAPVAAITAGLRQKFDPRGILNTGLMG